MRLQVVYRLNSKHATQCMSVEKNIPLHSAQLVPRRLVQTWRRKYFKIKQALNFNSGLIQRWEPHHCHTDTHSVVSEEEWWPGSYTGIRVISVSLHEPLYTSILSSFAIWACVGLNGKWTKLYIDCERSSLQFHMRLTVSSWIRSSWKDTEITCWTSWEDIPKKTWGCKVTARNLFGRPLSGKLQHSCVYSALQALFVQRHK